MRKLIISLPVLATILTAASTTTAAYGQDFLKGSPDDPVQIDPEHASPSLVEPSSPSSTPPATAQQQTAASTVYESPMSGYSIALPPGWVIQDIDQSLLNRGTTLLQDSLNFEHLGVVCKEEDSLPAIGDTSECRAPETGELIERDGQGADVRIYRFPDLQSRPELRGLNNIAAGEIIPLYTNWIRELSTQANPSGASLRFDLGVEQPMTTTTQQLQGVVAELITNVTPDSPLVGSPSSHETKTFGFFLVDPEQNNGYALVSSRWNPSITIDQLPPEIFQIFQGFEISSSEVTTTTPATTTTTTTPQAANITTQDPDFARFMQTASECVDSAAFGSSGATMTQEQCTQFLEQGQEKWCGLAAYDAQKCAQTTRLTAAWNNLVNLSERYGFSDIPSLGELGIDPRTIAPSP